MTKIAYIGPTGTFGGVRAIVEHLNHLGARGHDVTLLVTDGGQINWLPAYFTQRPVTDPGGGYDVLVGTAIGTWPGTLDLARKMNARPVGFMQMAEWLFFPKGSELYNKHLEMFTTPLDGVMTISDWLARLAEEIPDRRVHHIQNGIDTKLFFRQPFPDLPPFDGVTIVTEGYSHNPAKDVDEMTLRAIRRMRYDEGRNIRVFGFSQYGQPSEVFDRYWTQPPQHVIRWIYSSADIFLKASRFEGRPGPDMEAMACGTPVCRAITQGDDDLIHETTCLKVEYGNQSGFEQNLRLLMMAPSLRGKLAQQGIEYARAHPWDVAVDKVEKALTGAVSQPQRSPQESAHNYELSTYDDMQRVILEWETGQAMFLARALSDMLQPKNVIDIGCGPGNYLVGFKPCARVLGVDGAPKAGQVLEPDEFIRADLRKDWRPPSTYDLALCIEVGEHLPPDRADYLVDLLTSCAANVFFCAAQPGQGGTLHLNEQPREWWLEKFRARGFDLHPRNAELQAEIAANPHAKRVQWLIWNSILLGKVDNERVA